MYSGGRETFPLFFAMRHITLADSPDAYTRCADIWLAASLDAHDFIPASFWHSAYPDMISRYLPSSTLFVSVEDGSINAFASICDGPNLAALFVDPAQQGKGIGTTLLAYVMARYPRLSLSVYAKNQRAFHFYQLQGFSIQCEQQCAHSGEVEYVMVSEA